MQEIRGDPARGFLCIDWNNDDEMYEIMGNENDANYTRLEVIFTSCNYRHTMLGYQDEPMHPDCHKSVNEQREYLGPVHF